MFFSKFQNVSQFWKWNMAKIYVKTGENRRFLAIGVSATLAECSVPNIRPILTEYSVSVVHYYIEYAMTLKVET